MVDITRRELGMVPYTSLSHGTIQSDNTKRRDKQNIMLLHGGMQRGTTGDTCEEIDVNFVIALHG